MAVRYEKVPGLTWVAMDSRGENLIAVVDLDFDVYDGYDITSSGTAKLGIARPANGIVIDNLDNPGFVEVTAAPLFDRVPPFTRQLTVLPPLATQVSFRKIGGRVRAVFYTGLYPGATGGVNLPSAFSSAQA